MNLATFLITLVGPVAARIIAVFGVELVVLTGLAAGVSQLKTMVTSNIGSLPQVTVQLAGLLGIWTAIGIYFGALSFALTWRATKGFAAIAKT